MVSFIIPVYNGELFIERCIYSIINSTSNDSDYEVIIIDDGSQDGTHVIIDQIAKKYIFVKVLHQENAGVSAARKAGIVQASGEWIVFVDADDIVTADIVKIISAYEKQADWLIFSGNFLETSSIDMSAPLNKMNTLAAILNQSENIIFKKAHFNTVWSKAYKRSIIKENKIEFEEILHHGEDMLFNIDYLKRCNKICCVAQSVYTLCANGSSATHKYQKNCIQNDRAFFELLNKRNVIGTDSSIQKAYNRMVLNGIWICIGQYFAHPLNKAKMKDKKRQFVDFLNQEPYKLGLKNYYLEKKIFRKIVFALLNFHFYSLVLRGFLFIDKPESLAEMELTVI